MRFRAGLRQPPKDLFFLNPSWEQVQIIEKQDLGPGELVDHFPIAAVPSGNGKFIVKLGAADVEGAVSFPASLVGQGAG